MANRALLHKKKLDEFRGWLMANNFEMLTPKGPYEVLRWRPTLADEPMPIVFNKNIAREHLSLNNSAIKYVKRYLAERKAKSREEYEAKRK